MEGLVRSGASSARDPAVEGRERPPALPFLLSADCVGFDFAAVSPWFPLPAEAGSAFLQCLFRRVERWSLCFLVTVVCLFRAGVTGAAEEEYDVDDQRRRTSGPRRRGLIETMKATAMRRVEEASTASGFESTFTSIFLSSLLFISPRSSFVHQPSSCLLLE